MAQLYRRQAVQWALIGLGGAVLFILAIAGFARYATWHQLHHSILDNLYLSLQLISLNSGAIEPPIPLELNLARFLLPLLAAGAGIKAIWQIFNQQIRTLRLSGVRNHVIICGLSRKGYLLARRFCQLGDQVVVIESDDENDWLESCRKLGMFVLLGDASDPTLLSTAGVQRARGIFAVCDDDGINTEIAMAAKHLVPPSRDKPLTCLLHVADPRLCALLRQQEKSLDSPLFRLELFNVFERGARQMLYEFPAWDSESTNKKSPQVLLIGLGRLGENLLLHAARDWRFRRSDPAQRLRITVIDRAAVKKAESLAIRYPSIVQTCDISTLQMEIRSPEFERAAFLKNEQGQVAIDRIYICVDDDSLGLHTGLVLLQRLAGSHVPIVIRMAEQSGLAALLEEHKNGDGKYAYLSAFGYLDHTCTPDLLSQTPRDILARAAYEEIGLASQPTRNVSNRLAWEALGEADKQGCYRQIDGLMNFLKTCGYSLQPIDQLDLSASAFSTEKIGELSLKAYQDLCAHPGETHWLAFLTKNQGSDLPSPGIESWDKLAESEKATVENALQAVPGFINRTGYQLV